MPPGTRVPDGHKWCPDCGVVKPWDQFPRTTTTATGRATYCLPCHNARGKASKDKVGGSRTYHLSRRYGISAEEFDVMLAVQGGLCAICRNAPAEHVDHCHETGRVRQLCCFNCNGGLGQFRDDPHVLRAAAAYVERHRDGRTPAAGPPVADRDVPRRVRRSRDPVRSDLRRRGAGCPHDEVVRTRVAALLASLEPPTAG
ncbi:endonuclease VII domain-containing protein [Blastococcus sp. SYSU D01050]